MTWIGVLVLLAVIILARALKVVKAYERAVIFRLGKFVRVRGPGLFFTIPLFETMVKIDLRAVRFDVPPQKVLTQDEKIAGVRMIVSYRIIDPEKAVTQVENHRRATSEIAIESLKDVATRTNLLDFYSVEFKERLQGVINEKIRLFGIEVTEVELTDAWGAFDDKSKNE